MTLQVKRFINSIFSSNTFLLYTEESPDCYLIDCGDAEPVINEIKGNRKYLRGIFITHSHFDHIYGLTVLINQFPKAVIYTSPHGKEGLYSEKLNFSKYHDIGPYIYNRSNGDVEIGRITILEDNDEIHLFSNFMLEVLFTPGHDWSSLSFKVDKYLFTGDSYIPNLEIVTTFPKSNKKDAKKSLSKILEQITPNTIIYPGHGEPCRGENHIIPYNPTNR